MSRKEFLLQCLVYLALFYFPSLQHETLLLLWLFANCAFLIAMGDSFFLTSASIKVIILQITSHACKCNFSPFNFNNTGSILIHKLLHYTTLHFVNQRNYKSLTRQAHILTLKCYRLNIIILHLAIQSRIRFSSHVPELGGLPLPPCTLVGRLAIPCFYLQQ